MTALGGDLELSGVSHRPIVCAHCALPVPRGLIDPDDSDQFCCEGCRTVFAIVRANGLDRYYEMRREMERVKAKVDPICLTFSEFDDPAFGERYATTNPDGTVSVSLLLEGVHCAACVWLIEKLPRVVPGEGVLESCLNFRRSTVTVRFEPERVRMSQVARGLASLGYRPHPPRGLLRDELRARESRQRLVMLGVAGALAGNVMLLAIALYAGMLEGISAPTQQMLRGYSAALGLIALFWPGRVFFAGAVAALRARTPHLDIPIALALFVGGAWGTANTIRGTGEIYFDTLTILVFLLLVGRFLQHRQQRRAADAVELLFTLTPRTIRLIENNEVVTRPIEAAQIGDTAEVLAGQTIPADGEVLFGSSTIDNALLTGESTPLRVGVGGFVHAGTVNLSSTLRLRVMATGEETRAGQLMRLVAEASANKPEIVQLADRVAGWFVVVVSGLAIGTAAVWAFIEPSEAIEHAIALLIVTCPCALGLATPLVFTASLGRLASLGVLVKGGVTLEQLARAGTVFVDKTGTLTTGSLRVDAWTGSTEVRPLAAALEQHSTHPIAVALSAQSDESTDTMTVKNPIQFDGLGIVGVVNGRTLTIGSRVFMDSRGIQISESFARWADEHAKQGHTPVFLAEGETVVAAASVLGDLRPESRDFVRKLNQLGLPVTMLTGDRPDAAASMAQRVGMDPNRVIASAMPESKIEQIREAQRTGQGKHSVVMVGDGVNDAGALAAADVGIAVAGGAEASLQAADIYVKDRSLLAIPQAVSAARSTLARVRICLVVSLGYNAVAASLAMMGLIHPLLAAVLMPFSSLTVLGIAAMRPAWAKQGWAKPTEGASVCL